MSNVVEVTRNDPEAVTPTAVDVVNVTVGPDWGLASGQSASRL